MLQADRQEALVRAEQRRMAIERANKGLFDATDDVKALHSKLLLSEVSTLTEHAAHLSLRQDPFAAFYRHDTKPHCRSSRRAMSSSAP
jgi:hypothetical protein